MRAGAKPPAGESADLSAAQKAVIVGLDGWPPPLRTVVQADLHRVYALTSNRRRTADLAVPEVVRGLDELLDLVAEQIRQRPQPTTELPLDDVADLLGIPSDQVATSLDRHGRGDRRKALRAIKQIRAQLRELASAPDHSRLTRLVRFVVRISLVIDLVPEAATTLVPIALERFTTAQRDVWREHDLDEVAGAAHNELTEESDNGSALPVHAARAWMACFQRDWPLDEKLRYWEVLDELTRALREDSAEELRTARRNLAALKVQP